MAADLAAVVFDCDGTLVDSEPLTRRCMERVLADMGLELTDAHFTAMVGRAWPESSDVLVDQVGVRDLDAYLDGVRAEFVARRDELDAFADAVELAVALAVRGVPMAVCTSSGRAHLDHVLQMPSIAPLPFAATVTREDTERHKPDPAPYVLAAERLGVPPRACVAIEDSPVGTRAALAAGMRVVVVDHGLHDMAAFEDLDVTITTRLSLADVLD